MMVEGWRRSCVTSCSAMLRGRGAPDKSTDGEPHAPQEPSDEAAAQAAPPMTAWLPRCRCTGVTDTWRHAPRRGQGRCPCFCVPPLPNRRQAHHEAICSGRPPPLGALNTTCVETDQTGLWLGHIRARHAARRVWCTMRRRRHGPRFRYHGLCSWQPLQPARSIQPGCAAEPTHSWRIEGEHTVSGHRAKCGDAAGVGSCGAGGGGGVAVGGTTSDLLSRGCTSACMGPTRATESVLC